MKNAHPFLTDARWNSVECFDIFAAPGGKAGLFQVAFVVLGKLGDGQLPDALRSQLCVEELANGAVPEFGNAVIQPDAQGSVVRSAADEQANGSGFGIDQDNLISCIQLKIERGSRFIR